MLHRNGPVDYKIWGVMQQCVYETKIYYIWPAKTLDVSLKVGLTLKTSGVTVWDIVCMLVVDTLNTCC